VSEAVPAVVAQGLWRTFGPVTAVAGLDLWVPAGSFFGLVGPNGAGKTTALKMMTGLLRPSAGRVWVAGVDVWPDPLEAKRRIGVLPEELRLFERLSGAELLTYVGLLRRLPAATVAARVEDMLSVLDLQGARDRLVADYSTGMRKKVALGAALLHRPAVLFLDEPFESVDPVSTRIVGQVLGQFRAGGGTVVFSSHVMDTVERLCDGVAVVHRGQVVAHGPMEAVLAAGRLEDVFIRAVGAEGVAAASLSWLSDPAAG